MFEIDTSFLMQDTANKVFISLVYGFFMFIYDFTESISLISAQNGGVSQTKNPMMHSDVQAL